MDHAATSSPSHRPISIPGIRLEDFRVLRSASHLTWKVILAAVLATGCAGPAVVVEERIVPAGDPPTKLTSKAAQPARLTPHSESSEVAKSLLLHWDIRKEGK